MNDFVRTIRPNLGRRALAGVALTSTALLLAGCGSSTKSTATDDAAAISAAIAGAGSSAASAAAPTGGGDDAKAAAVDVCSLLTPADAQSIGTKTALSSLPNVTYKLMSEDPEKTASSSSCTLTIYNELADGTSGNEAIVTVQVQPTKYLDTINAKKRSGGPGDATWDETAGYDEVVSGDYFLKSTQSQGATNELIDDMYTAMIPNLKTQLGTS